MYESGMRTAGHHLKKHRAEDIGRLRSCCQITRLRSSVTAGQTIRMPRYALIRYRYCTSNQSLITSYVANHWGQGKLFRRTDGSKEREACPCSATSSPESLAQRPRPEFFFFINSCVFFNSYVPYISMALRFPQTLTQKAAMGFD